VYTLDQEIKLTPNVLRHLITLQEDTAEEIIEEIVTEEREPRSNDR
jgi:ribosomal protein S6